MDLTTDVGIMEYLQSKEETRPITKVEKLSGGTANFVWRATVDSSTPDVFGGNKTVIVKHAEEYVANYKEMRLDTIRMEYENRVLTIVAQAGQEIATDKVHVPKVFFFDGPNCVTIQEDGGSAPHLKDYISSLTEAPSKALSETIGSSLGDFIARLHLHGHKHHAQLNKPEQMKSQMAIELSRTVLYDNIPKAVKRHDFIAEEDIVTLLKAAEWGGNRLMTEPETLAHGDFWPGNILVKASADNKSLEQLYVIDWEMSRYAPAAMDLGQVMAELITLDKYRHPCTEIQTSFLDAYAKTYKDKLVVMDLKTAAIHTGCHLIVWAPYTGWFPLEDKEKAKEVVSLGAEYIKHAWSEDWDWFRNNSSYKVLVEALRL